MSMVYLVPGFELSGRRITKCVVCGTGMFVGGECDFCNRHRIDEDNQVKKNVLKVKRIKSLVPNERERNQLMHCIVHTQNTSFEIKNILARSGIQISLSVINIVKKLVKED